MKLLTGLLLITTVACSANSDPDPGNQRLKALKREGANRLVFPAARLFSEKEWERELGRGFTDNGTGPMVDRIYWIDAFPLPADEDVFAWHKQRLATLGWNEYVNPDSDNLIVASRFFHKQIDHWCAHLIVSRPSTNQIEVRLSSAASSNPAASDRCLAGES